MNAHDVKVELKRYASVDRALVSQRFFKTGVGQYGEGDIFIGVDMPSTRKVARQFQTLEPGKVQKLLDSDIHEERMVGAVILVYQFEKADENARQKIYELYMHNVMRGRINNWDLVDVTTPNIVGEYLYDKPKDILYRLAKSQSLWQKRVAMLATFAFIKKGEPVMTVEIAEILLRDPHDLIQKAVGWMLREMGKRIDEQILTEFLDEYAHAMPRTMLRYAIERLSPQEKQYYMSLKG